MITFYSLTKSTPISCIARILHKITQGEPEKRFLVLCESEELCLQWDRALWTFNPEVFLPHGLVSDPDPEKQPTLLSTKFAKPENNAQIIFFSDINSVRDWDCFEQYIWVTDTPPEAINAQLPSKKKRGFIEKSKSWEEVIL